MLLLDILDSIIRFIVGIIPAVIVLISLLIAYYFYIKYESIYNKNNIKENKENFDNFFCNLGCKLNKDKQCRFQLSKHKSFECPMGICLKKFPCKKEHFVNQNIITNPPNNPILSKIIMNEKIRKQPNYTCFDGNNCITKEKNLTNPSENNCGHPFISNYPNKIYDSIDECYKDNIAYKYLNKEDCLEMPHGYGWLGGEGCVRGSPEGPNNLNSDFFLNGRNKKLYTPSNPTPYTLPLYKPVYRSIL